MSNEPNKPPGGDTQAAEDTYNTDLEIIRKCISGIEEDHQTIKAHILNTQSAVEIMAEVIKQKDALLSELMGLLKLSISQNQTPSGN